ncbi:MAG: HemK/PrmC family methyltransferase [Mariniphaga sp.]
MEQEQKYNDLLEILKGELIILPDKSEENARNTLHALWHTAFGNRVSAILAEQIELPVLQLHHFLVLDEYLKERLSGVPLAHLTERQHFLGMDFILNKGLYIPRKETELLAKTAIDTIKKEFEELTSVNIIDLCTGIGTVALAIGYYCKNTFVYGSDIFEPAIIAAKINVKHFSLENRVSFYHANLFDPFESLSFKNKTHIIVCAPPYISSLKVKQMPLEISNHEPSEAFDAGPYGLSIFSKLISKAPQYLCKNGYLIFECGLGQGEFLANRMITNEHYGNISKICDENGNVRVIKAKMVRE